MTATIHLQSSNRNSVLARLMVGFDGTALFPELAEYLRLGLAGVALYPRNFESPRQLRQLTDEIRQATPHPVLIGIDQEGGERFALREPFTVSPSVDELGRLGDVETVKRVAQAMALELRAAGCNLNFAPMLDLSINAESPVTKHRSFGRDPHQVANMGVAFHQGLRLGGVLSCAKHFPGHGDTAVDPHQDLPVFLGDLERLESSELIPFAAAIAAEIPLIMTAHILLPQIDPAHPASLSRPILDGILRRRMQFTGVILADDLGMGAIARKHGPGSAAILSLLAGTDIAMLCHEWASVAPAIAALQQAHEEGRFDRAEGRTSLERIDRAITMTETSEVQPPIEIVGCARHRALASEIRHRLTR